MKFIKALLSAAILSAPAAFAQERDPMRDLQIGMQGLKEAANNPELLAQLMHDLQNPEMMAEAQKMMNDPAFQKEMKKFSNSKEFKKSIKQTQEAMADPSTAAEMEARMEMMVKKGNDELKKSAASAMEEAMASMKNPEVMAEMTRMMKDPAFQGQLAAMAKDPSFQHYMSAMQDMMQDPATRAKFEQAGESIRAGL